MPFESAKKMVACIASGHQAISAGPNDMCKTPAPPAPVPPPMPYPNIAMSAMNLPGCTKTLAMMTPIWNKDGEAVLSNGDQPGIAMGMISGKIMGKCGIIMASTDVKAQGAGVVRTGDKCKSNA